MQSTMRTVTRKDSDGLAHQVVVSSEQGMCAVAAIAMIHSLRARMSAEGGVGQVMESVGVSVNSCLHGLSNQIFDDQVELAMRALGPYVKKQAKIGLGQTGVPIWPSYLGVGRPALLVLQHWTKKDGHSSLADQHAMVAVRFLRDRSRVVLLDPSALSGKYVIERPNTGHLLAGFRWDIYQIYYSPAAC